MRFLVDAQLPPGLARWIVTQGHEAEHVGDIGLLAAGDQEIAAYAEADGAVLVSKDEDFLTIRLPDRFAFVWLRCGNCTNRVLLGWVEARWEQLIALLEQGERIVEMR
jgi:predicted nuclease of predicted toxin-antitoxin system